MQPPSLLTPWTVRFLRALSWYGFSSAFIIYLVTLVVGQFRPGAFLLTVSLTKLLQITVFLGACVLLLPKPEDSTIRKWGRSSTFALSAVTAFVIGLVVIQQLALQPVLRFAIATIVAITAFLVAHALLNEDNTDT